MEVKVINKGTQPLPEYATEGSAGMDLRANITDPVVLGVLDRALIPTGIYMEIPSGYEGQVRPRSGLAIKNGITCLNTPGTIDSDYRGEIGVELINLSNIPYTVQPGDKIAQLVISLYEKVTLVESTELSDTERGEGGYGSTGTN